MHQEGRRRRPDMTHAVADDVAMAVQVAADDGPHRRAVQAAQQPGARLGVDRRRRRLGLVRRLQEQRLVQGRTGRDAAPSSASSQASCSRSCGSPEPSSCALMPSTPSAGVESEAIGAEYRHPPLQAVRIDDLAGFLAGRLVAYVIAGNGMDRRLQSTERLSGEAHFSSAVGTVDAEIAAHDHGVGCQPVRRPRTRGTNCPRRSRASATDADRRSR